MLKDSRIYIAGHQGLVGSAIVRLLKKEGYTNLLLRTRSELDLLEPTQVRDFFEKEQPEYVFLAAAKVGGIMANKEAPADFLYENLVIETNVINSAYRSRVTKLLFLGSSSIYPKDCPQPIKEEYLLTGPLEPSNKGYALAKIAGIYLCQSFNEQYGTNFISAMPTNLYGEGDSFDLVKAHVLPAMLQKFDEAKRKSSPSVELFGTGTARRELLHVDDLASACLMLMQKHNGSEVVNVGTGEDVTIAELARKIQHIVGYTGEIVWDSSKPDGTERKLLEVSKIKALGWTPTMTLDMGIRNLYDWYTTHHE